MSKELFYTSAPSGLDLGTSGFCTVAATHGLGKRLRERLQALSSYRHPFAPLDPRNPVVYSHLWLDDGGRRCHVLSRIADAPLDYSGRGNYLAHHVVLEVDELPAAGPAWLLQQPNFLEGRWRGEPRWLREGRPVPHGDIRPDRCRHWEQLAGDAGWAGVLLQEFERNPGRAAALLVRPGTDTLAVIAEALALLPPERRWDVTFSTYFLGVPPGTVCDWRVVFKEVQAAERAAWLGGALVLDLTAPLGAPRRPPRRVRPQRPGARPGGCGRPGKRGRAEPSRRPAPGPHANADSPRPPRREASDWTGTPEATAPPAEPAESLRESPRFTSREAPSEAGGTWLWGFVLGLTVGLLLVGGLGLIFWFVVPRARVRQLEQEREKLKAELGDSASNNEALEKKLKDSDDRVKSLEGDLKKQKNAFEQLQGKSTDDGKQAAEKEKDLDSRLAEKQKEIDSLTRELGKLRAAEREAKAWKALEDAKLDDAKEEIEKQKALYDKSKKKSDAENYRKLLEKAEQKCSKIISDHEGTNAAKKAEKILKGLKGPKEGKKDGFAQDR